MSVTIRDVAKAAGVSPSTVSKVINRSPLISSATTEHVKNIIHELNYTPNMRASNFAHQHTKSIVFLSLAKPHMAFRDPYIFEILTGAEKIIHQNKYRLEFINAVSLDNAYEIVKDIIMTKSADGFIIHGYAVSPDITNLLFSCRFPHILIGKPAFETSSSWIDINNIVAGEIAANFLYDRGIRKLAFIGGLKKDKITQMRLHGVCQFAMQRHIPLKDNFILFGEPEIYAGYELANTFFSNADIPEGIICENSITAAGAVKSLREHNIKIPEDLSFICFDNYPFSHMIDPLPTVVDIDVYSLGTEAARNLLNMLKKPQMCVQSYITLPTVIQRNSTK